MANNGKMDRRITIEKRTITRDAEGGNVETWATHANCWAEKVDTRGKESEVADADRSANETQFRVRYKPWLTSSGYQIIYRGEKYNITHVKEEGRFDTQLLTTTRTEGVE